MQNFRRPQHQYDHVERLDSGSADQFHLALTGQPDIHTFLFTFSADHYTSNIIQIEILFS